MVAKEVDGMSMTVMVTWLVGALVPSETVNVNVMVVSEETWGAMKVVEMAAASAKVTFSWESWDHR